MTVTKKPPCMMNIVITLGGSAVFSLEEDP